jgi:hypothetical protein
LLLFSLLLFLVLFSALIQAEQVAAKMIEKGQMKASIDQLEGILEFENNTNTFAVWDSQVAGVCQQVFFFEKNRILPTVEKSFFSPLRSISSSRCQLVHVRCIMFFSLTHARTHARTGQCGCGEHSTDK